MRIPYLLIIALSAFSAIAVAQDPAGEYPFTSTRPVTSEDLEGKELAELKIMRNEIFARHGHTFKSEDLKTHFGKQSWYKPLTTDASSLLTAMEKQNIDAIKKRETQISATADFDSFYTLFSKLVEQNDVAKLSDLIIIDYFESVDQFKTTFDREKDELGSGIAEGTPRDISNDEVRLAYGEFYQGVQYKFIIFKKIGCCWYIHAFQRAG